MTLRRVAKVHMKLPTSDEAQTLEGAGACLAPGAKAILTPPCIFHY
jgi:hypothetical protein